MKTISAFLAALALALSISAAPAQTMPQGNQSRGDQRSARAEMQAGRNMPIREIERRIIPRMEASDEYIGFEYDETAQAYRLKFIRNGRMIWVDVDAQTARILRISR